MVPRFVNGLRYNCINIHEQKINGKLNDNIFAIEGNAIFSRFHLLIEFNIGAEKIHTFTCQMHKVIPL